MRKLAIAVAVGAAALFGGFAANAADNTPKATIASGVSQNTDMSSQHRRHHGHFRMHRHWGHGYGYNRPYANSYGYYRQPHYYHGGPIIRHGFGGGGWHHRHHGHRW